jgi:serine/threonine protein kinase
MSSVGSSSCKVAPEDRTPSPDPSTSSASQRLPREGHNPERLASSTTGAPVAFVERSGETIVCREWRLGGDGHRIAVLVVRPVAEHPSPSILDRLTHEYELRDELDGRWAVKALELGRDGSRALLVLEDTGGKPLEQLLGTPTAMARFVRLGIGIAVALGKLHARGLVHKDIKPENILVNDATGEAWLTGFGIAARLCGERQSPDPPETIAGTLAYMAPEQTGRMNRSTDSRSDLYSLGITFYQILSRSLLSKSYAELARWRHVLLEALGPNSRLMTDFVPKLKFIVGDQPPVPELEPQQAQARFQLVFRRFIGVFARPEHPLALFLDDLQWLDAATLDLLEGLLTRSDLQHVMSIGAYRDNEVTAAHSLMRKIDAIKTAGGMVAEIKLPTLARESSQRNASAISCPRSWSTMPRVLRCRKGSSPSSLDRECLP